MALGSRTPTWLCPGTASGGGLCPAGGSARSCPGTASAAEQG